MFDHGLLVMFFSDEAKAIYIQGTAHCANMYPERPEDLPQLKMARKKILDLIKEWVKN